MYEIYEKLLKLRGLTSYKVSQLTGVSSATLSQWKKGQFLPKDDKRKKIADCLGVTLEFLDGKTSIIQCPDCGFGNNPLSEQSEAEHERYHKMWEEAVSKFGFCWSPQKCDYERSNAIFMIRDRNSTDEEVIESYDSFLKAEFSNSLRNCNFNPNHLDFDSFCAVKMNESTVRDSVSASVYDKLVEKYGRSSDDYSPIGNNSGTYYMNKETVEMAQKLFENKDMRLLFDAAKDAAPEDLKMAHDLLMRMKRSETHEDDMGC